MYTAFFLNLKKFLAIRNSQSLQTVSEALQVLPDLISAIGAFYEQIKIAGAGVFNASSPSRPEGCPVDPAQALEWAMNEIETSTPQGDEMRAIPGLPFGGLLIELALKLISEYLLRPRV